jgi:F-type H+-transporting ATPase subunit epsilon
VAHKRFQAEVLTPEGQVFEGEVEQVSTRTTVGSLSVLAGHQPLLGLLEPTELRLYKSDSDIERYAQGEGYLQMTGDRALILVQEAIPPRDLNAADLRDRLSRAQEVARRAEDESEEQRQAERDARRWEAFLRIAEGA